MKKPIPIVNKLLTIMKISLLQIVISIGFSGFTLAGVAIDSNGQGILDKPVSISAQNKKLRGVLMDIEKSIGIKFSFNPNTIPIDEKISVQLKNIKLKDALEDILVPINVGYEVSGDYIILRKNPATSFIDDSNAVPYIEGVQTVSGTVLDEDNGPLPGVNILEKGTSNGTTSDADGKYSINVNSESSVLVFSFIGYTPQEVLVGTRSEVSISMQPDFQSLDEVVVVGYGTQIKKDVTGSIASVSGKDLIGIPVSSPDALLQGKAAGVQVVQNSGTPGGEVFVRIRGTASLLGETRPLFVIDGVPMNNSTAISAGGQRTSVLADINPADIESMEILKDAAATAIYGSRGSNGVVLITTKRGKLGKARINFDAYTGVQTVSKTMDVLNGQQFSDLITDELNNRNPSLINNPPYNGGALDVTGINTDYQDEIFQKAPISSYTLSVTGADEKMATYLSLGYFTQEGTIIGQEFDRLTGRVNLDYQATSKLKVGTSTTFSNTKQARVDNDFSGYSVLANALIRNPNLPVYNADGTYSVDPFQTENPVQLANEITFNTTQRRIVTNVYAQYEILKGLTFRTVAGIDYTDERVERFVPSTIISRQGRAEAIATNSDEQTFISDNTLTYTKAMDQHRFTVLAGFGIQQSTFAFLQAGGQTAGSNIITTLAIAEPYIPTQNITSWGLLSYFGRANYSFKDKYLIEGSFRIDGSSRFGVDNRYGTFPGVSFGWRMKEEGFLQDVTAISDLKLRVGYGVTGNQDGIGNFAAQALYQVNQNYDGNPGIAQQNIPNPDLGWESTASTNIGIDLSILNARVNVTADAYIKNTSNLIFQRQLPFTSGFDGIGNANIGEMQNRGIELTLSTRNLTGEFEWTTDFNIAFNKSEITFLPNNGALGSDYIFTMPDAYGVEGPYSIYRIGQPVGNFYGHIFQGVYASDSDVPGFADNSGLYARGVRGGDVNFLDINNDGVYSRDFDRAIIGNALPKHIGGMTNRFAYKGLDLVVVMNWSYGNDIYNMTRAAMTGMSDDFNQSVETLDRWKQQGDITHIPKAIYGTSSVSGAAPTDASSRYIEDGSFLRFRTITLGYNLPSVWLEKIGISSARIYLSGQNLITITDYSGLDPENQNLGNSGVPILGVDYLTQPQPKVVMGGITLSF